MNRRAQLSVFIIIGIILLIIGGMIYYINARQAVSVVQPAPKQIATGEDLKARINSYVMDCLRAALAGRRTAAELPLVWRMAERGGTLTPAGDVYDRSRTRIQTWCRTMDPEDAGCVNQAPSRESVEFELVQILQNPALSSLPACLAKLTDPNTPLVPGGVVEIAPPTIAITINPTDITVRLVLNGTAKLQAIEVQFGEFISITPSPFGRLLQIGTDIANAEARTGGFDKELYMMRNGGDVLIQKERPYPYVIYNLTTLVPGGDVPLTLMFGIKGWLTQNTAIRAIEATAGCCVMPSSDCRANMRKDDCLEEGGAYTQDVSCGCPQVAKPLMTGCCQAPDASCALVSSRQQCNGTYYEGDLACASMSAQCTNLRCMDLAYYYNDFYGPKKQGDSWCTSDTVTGFGTDFVGNRHYVHSCIDGKEFVEPCRDFREEICVDGYDATQGRSRATCKLNRWYDCYAQHERGSCEDLSTRDCLWVPSIPWNGKAADKSHPFVAHAKMQCVPFVPPGFAVWQPSAVQRMVCAENNQQPNLDYPRAQGYNTLHLCSRLGDCGNKRNWVGELTKKGYSNPLGKPKAKHYRAYTLAGLHNPIGTYLDTADHYTNPRYGLYSLQHQIFGWVDGVTLSDASQNTVSPAVSLPSKIKKGAIKCKPWAVPTTSDVCNLCNLDPLRPCTEYRCRSLGRCQWQANQGVGVCAAQGAITAHGTGPLIVIDPQSFMSGATKLAVTPVGQGFRTAQPLPGNYPVSLMVTTDKKAVCVAGFTPRGVDWEALDEPNDFMVVNPAAWVTAFDVPIGTGTYETAHPVSFTTPSASIIAQVQALLPFITDVTIYITCEDEQGNPSVNELTLTAAFSSEEYVDTAGPVISVAEIATDDEDERVLRLATDEAAAECRGGTAGADYESLISIDCAPQALDMSLTEDWAQVGSKICSTPAPSEPPEVVQCKDAAGNVGVAVPLVVR